MPDVPGVTAARAEQEHQRTVEISEAECVAKVAAGDRDAFGQLVAAHLPGIQLYAQRMTGNPAPAEDITQEVFLRLWLRAAEFDANKARLTTWLHRMAHNLAIDHLRKVQRDTPWGDEEDRRAAPDSPEVQSGKDVRDALLKLPERQRSALALTYYQDLSNREVAEIMGLGTRAVESLLVRARGALKQHLEIAS